METRYFSIEAMALAYANAHSGKVAKVGHSLWSVSVGEQTFDW